MEKNKTTVVVPNWNGADSISKCLDSLLTQSAKFELVVVDNGSIDDSVTIIKHRFTSVTLLEQPKNLGFAGGVNVGIKRALANGSKYVALFNNDAVAEEDWLKNLVSILDNDPKVGIATGKLVDSQRHHLDSTGDFYTTWGLPYPRGRGEPNNDKYDLATDIFAASGGASLYRVDMLQQIGLFDEAFFAYYEDIDISFRAQLAGWKVHYEPKALAYHEIGATSGKIKGFTTYQTMKNLPMIVRKNVPLRLLPTVLPRFWIAYTSFYFKAISSGRGWPATKGGFVALINLPRNLYQRRAIHKNRKVSVDYINNILIHDLPPNAARLRALRQKWWHIIGRHSNG